ncbi:DMT family transporter [Streptomyces spinosirectus]|uniref:DMT family transporter n=1 Tax=Streptomyces TaxID=1883 RepID=UPI000D33F07A|nr:MULTISPECIES: DMT family transporter [Streptomyces]MBY8343950.1 DMT family transporter [Streptomyces plumbidurans]PTM94831.1 drug/metabolite transporter (DMT)-like permease [Streptomyces sp. VMFN-G11Ma]UIR22855.1 DMT family transporter [Streptomyces spinosirectus]
MNIRRPELLAPGAAVITVVLWASAFVSIRSAGDAYSPGALALGRLLSGVLVLGVILAVRGEGLPPRSAWRGIAISGALWFGFYMVVLNWGEQQVDAGTAALVVNIGPILIALLGARLLGDPMPPRLLAGMAVSFAGAVAVGLSMSGDGGSSVLGVVLCLLAAVGYASGVVAQKPALGRASALQVTTFGCLVGAVCCLPFAGQLVGEAADAPVSATLNMVYLGVFPTALAFTTWAYALARTTASRMGATTYAVPALVVLMSWLALGEVPGLLTLGGGVLCLAGVAVSRSRPRNRTAERAAAPEEAPEPQPERAPEGA